MIASNQKRSPNKGRKFPAEPLTTAEVEKLLACCSKRAPTGVRNRSLIAVLYRGGLRISEALALEPRDLDADQQSIRVRHGKGDRSRLVAMDAGAWSLLETWLNRRKKLAEVTTTSPVFCTLRGTPLLASYCRELFTRLGAKAKIEKRVHAHQLRHSFAFELIGEGVALHTIQAALGHSNLSTTSRYVHHLHPLDVVEALRGRTWSDRK